jgi:hypothetical protein
MPNWSGPETIEQLGNLVIGQLFSRQAAQVFSITQLPNYTITQFKKESWQTHQS